MDRILQSIRPDCLTSNFKPYQSYITEKVTENIVKKFNKNIEPIQEEPSKDKVIHEISDQTAEINQLKLSYSCMKIAWRMKKKGYTPK